MAVGPSPSAGARPQDMRSSFTRRRFLTVLAGVALGGMTLWGLRPWTRGILARFSGRYESLTHPALARAATGALSARALQVLQAAVSTLVDTTVEMSHYVEYFTWRAENLPGYSQLYRGVREETRPCRRSPRRWRIRRRRCRVSAAGPSADQSQKRIATNGRRSVD